MQVILLATDEQRSLPPLTDTLPAPMLPIVDRPVMATSVEILARAGYKQILVSLYERGGQIASYFGDGRRWGVEIRYITQREAWGSAGALRFAGGLIHETVLVLPGDALLDLDVEAALQFHRIHGGMATAILHPGPSHDDHPLARLDDDGRLIFTGPGAGEPGGLRATGAFIFEPGALRFISPSGVCDLAEDLLPALLATGERVYGYTMHGYWNPLRGVEAFQQAQEVYLYSAYRQQAREQVEHGPAESVRFPSLEARAFSPGIWVGRDHSIHPSVKLAAPTYIGPACWIGREVELGPCTIVGANVVIDDEATVAASTVLSDTYVGRLVHVRERVVTPSTISDVRSGETIRVVDPFLVGRVGAPADGYSPVRRGITALVALALILLASPALLLLGLIALLTTGGVVRRVPRLGMRLSEGQPLRKFELLQFRTRRADGRHAPLGRLVERLELHRLPELVNVLLGDLSLVGVKPLSPEEAERLTEEWQQRRHERPAAFTGLWYLQTDPASDLDAVLVADVYYTATRTWRGDLLLLLRTPAAWLRRCITRYKTGGGHEQLVQVDTTQSI
jgi:NDP-sugar pyrophosphorylase family protein/lipopolysaccharide/colanic/teichoic acid biosynthesis glycosyltransferase